MAAAAADGPTEVECVRPKHTHTRRENRRLTAPSVVCFVSCRLLQKSITELKKQNALAVQGLQGDSKVGRHRR